LLPSFTFGIFTSTHHPIIFPSFFSLSNFSGRSIFLSTIIAKVVGLVWVNHYIIFSYEYNSFRFVSATRLELSQTLFRFLRSICLLMLWVEG
ncbi:hypothetical protein VIGAN_06199800, partial [Vigna angularis var. angularis]